MESVVSQGFFLGAAEVAALAGGGVSAGGGWSQNPVQPCLLTWCSGVYCLDGVWNQTHTGWRLSPT